MPHEMNFFTPEERREAEKAKKLQAAQNLLEAPGKTTWSAQGASAKRRRAVVPVLLAALVVATALLAVLFWPTKDGEALPAGASGAQQASAPSAPESLPIVNDPSEPPPAPEPTPALPAAPAVTAQDWFAVLVDVNHPLPDDYDPETDMVDPAGYYFDSRAAAELLRMLQDGTAAGLQFKIDSGFRSRTRQEQVYNAELAYQRGTGLAEEEALRQTLRIEQPAGQSEHNSGLAVDLVALTNQREEEFAQTPEFLWLTEHAREYGFVLRYPEGKEEVTGVEYKPWHWRYVGAELAGFLVDNNYTLDEFHSLYLS